MRRFKQQISDEKCREILTEQKRGVLSLMGENGYPYGIPMDHWYCKEDGCIYFHGAKEGHKTGAIKKCSKACYTVYDEGFRRPGEWSLNINSVIVFGNIELVTDEEMTKEICTHLVRKFTDDEEYLEKELKNFLPGVQCLKLVPDHMTGKLVNES